MAAWNSLVLPCKTVYILRPIWTALEGVNLHCQVSVPDNQEQQTCEEHGAPVCPANWRPQTTVCFTCVRNNCVPARNQLLCSCWAHGVPPCVSLYFSFAFFVQLLSAEYQITRTDPRPAVRPAEGPNSFHWKNVGLEVLFCCTKFHEPHVVSEYAHF